MSICIFYLAKICSKIHYYIIFYTISEKREKQVGFEDILKLSLKCRFDLKFPFGQTIFANF
jgi:hypothetical protein